MRIYERNSGSCRPLAIGRVRLLSRIAVDAKKASSLEPTPRGHQPPAHSSGRKNTTNKRRTTEPKNSDKKHKTMSATYHPREQEPKRTGSTNRCMRKLNDGSCPPLPLLSSPPHFLITPSLSSSSPPPSQIPNAAFPKPPPPPTPTTDRQTDPNLESLQQKV